MQRVAASTTALALSEEELLALGAKRSEVEDDSKKLGNGLAKLVLTLLETLKQLMERQARRRMKEGSLGEPEIERLGQAFLKLDEKIAQLAGIFNLKQSELNLGLGALSPASASNSLVKSQQQRGDEQTLTLVDLLDNVIEKGVVVFGDLGISIAEVELIRVHLRLVATAVRREERGRRKNHKKRKIAASPARRKRSKREKEEGQ